MTDEQFQELLNEVRKLRRDVRNQDFCAGGTAFCVFLIMLAVVFGS